MADSKHYEYDLFVIGCGSGGVRAGRIAAGHGANVAIADDLAVGLGGTCVNVGCVPKKLMVYGSEVGHHWEEARGFGWEVGPRPEVTWPRLIENKNAEISRLNGIYKWLVTSKDATLIEQVCCSRCASLRHRAIYSLLTATRVPPSSFALPTAFPPHSARRSSMRTR